MDLARGHLSCVSKLRGCGVMILFVIMNTVAQRDTPYGRLNFKEYQNWVILTARRAGSEDLVTVEMTLDQWFDLPPVQYVVKTELSRQQPRRPAATSTDPAAIFPVPRGHIRMEARAELGRPHRLSCRKPRRGHGPDTSRPMVRSYSGSGRCRGAVGALGKQ